MTNPIIETGQNYQILFDTVSETLVQGCEKTRRSIDQVRRQHRITSFYLACILVLPIASLLKTYNAPSDVWHHPTIIGAVTLAIIVECMLAYEAYISYRLLNVFQANLSRLQLALHVCVGHGLALLDAYPINEFDKSSFEIKMTDATNAIAIAEYITKQSVAA